MEALRPAPKPTWPAGSVAARLFSEPFAFDFFQAVRLLQQLDRKRVPVGQGATPAQEAARFRGLVSMNFPPSAVYDLKPGVDKAPPVMTITFFGMFGPSGMLPRHYTELLFRHQRDTKGPEKFALRDWLDMFNHRLTAHFYRAWEKYRFWLAYERREPFRPQPDAFTNAVFSLIGMGSQALRDRLRIGAWSDGEGKRQERVLARVDDRVLIYFSGLLAHRPRNAVGLAGLLQDYLQLPVVVRQFHGQWLKIEADKQSRMGLRDGNCLLGEDLVVGERVWDVQSKIRIQVGPLPFERFQEYMPDRTPLPERKALFELFHLVRLYIGPELDFDIQLILDKESVPEYQMPEGTGDGPQLGWNTWLGSMTFASDADDAVFEGQELVLTNE